MWKPMLDVILAYGMWRHGGIWGLKQHLQSRVQPRAVSIASYDRYWARFGSWIGFNSEFASPPFFPHGPYGVFISGGSAIGRNATIFQHVVVGSNTLRDSKLAGSPTIGDNAYIGAGAIVVGHVTVGDNCRVGAGAVVHENLSDNSVAVQAPTRIIQKSTLDNRFYSQRHDGKWVYMAEGAWVEDPQEWSSTRTQGA